MSYEVALMASNQCKLRKLIPMIGLPHLGSSGSVSSNLPMYFRKVCIFEGTPQECTAMRDELAPNSSINGSARPITAQDGDRPQEALP